MIETALLTILTNGTVIIKSYDPHLQNEKVIPSHIVKSCSDFTLVNPYNVEDISKSYNELRFIDCAYMRMGEY